MDKCESCDHFQEAPSLPELRPRNAYREDGRTGETRTRLAPGRLRLQHPSQPSRSADLQTLTDGSLMASTWR